MKKIFFFAAVLFTAGALQAQGQASTLLLEECFEYTPGTKLISGTIESSDNYDAITGWSTQANKNAGLTRFVVTDQTLEYEGYGASGIGYGLKFDAQEETGQGVFKCWDRGISKDSTVYVAFMIRFPKQERSYSSPDYFLSFKTEPGATSTNFAGRVYADITLQDPETGTSYEGEEITTMVAKASTSPLIAVPTDGPYLTFDKTYLMVLKYHVGVLFGASSADELGHYDDEMWLYINPSLDKEPDQADIYQKDPTGYDAYRYSSSGKVMGGLRGICLRGGEYGKKNTIAPYIIGGIRAAKTWADVIGLPASDLNSISSRVKAAKRIEQNQVVIYRGSNRYSILGTTL